MTTVRLSHRIAPVFVALLAVCPAAASAQDTLARAKDFYASAAYEEALQVLSNLRGKSSPVDATEVAAYQVYCLVALGRSDEAKNAIEAIVRVDPLYRPSEAQVSPRVRTFFEDVRRPLLPEVVGQFYAKAKDAFDKKDLPVATAGFDKVIALLDEMGGKDNQGVADLRTLAGGFRDLARAGAAPPPAPEPPPGPQAANVVAEVAPLPASPAPQKANGASTIYTTGDADVRRPIAISQVMPQWRPENLIEERTTFAGALELVIGEDGKVLSATLLKSVHRRYDAVLLRAAQDWTFRPATRSGKPVKYRYSLAVQLGR
jgi:Gram-negative bacterial TonB protein C-terminal